MMVPKNIKKGFIEHSDYKLEIAIWKISAGDDKINISQPLFD
jgi:hypothetical protein